MTRKFKLKAEARRFFNEDEKLNMEIRELAWWKEHLIRQEFLQEVSRIYVDFGHEKISSTGLKSSQLSGWNSIGEEAHFNFTVKVLEIPNKQYRDMKIPELMDEIQMVIDKFFKNSGMIE